MLSLLPLVMAMSTKVSAEPLKGKEMVTIAATLVEMAQQDGVLSDKEHSLLAQKFPLQENTDPVLVFTLDRSNLPQSVLSLNMGEKQKESILHLLALVAIIDGQLTTPEKNYLNRFLTTDEESSKAMLKSILASAQKLYNRIQHEPVLETMKTLVDAQKKYHSRHKKYMSTTLCPQKSASQSIPWDICKSQFANLPWVIPEKVQGSYKMEGTQNAFVITGVIDIDGDGVAATYVSTHTNPIPKRIGNPNAD